MNKDQAESLLKALGSKPSATTSEWARGSCPLAPYTHKSGKDSHPSFGLYIGQGAAGRFHCFSCESGSLPKLLQLIEFNAVKSPGKFKGDIQKAREIIEQDEIDLPVLPSYQEFAHPKKQFVELPAYFLESFQPVAMWPRAMEYLVSRGFTAIDWVGWNLRYDAKDDRVVFPYYDVFGRLAGLRGRGVEFGGNGHWAPHHDYVWKSGETEVNNASLVWFNETMLDSPGPLVVVEGQFDAMRVARVFPRVLANMTAKPVIEKMVKLAQSEGVILMLDGDEAGRSATKKFAEFLDIVRVPVAVVLLPMVDDQGQSIKTDPDKLGEAWIAQALKNVGVDC